MSRCRYRIRVSALGLTAWLVAFCIGPVGCVSVTSVQHTRGNEIDSAKVSTLRKGTSTLTDVLEALGAPLEVHAHPDGRVLVYRFRARNVAELSLQMENIAQVVDVSQVLADILRNLSFSWSRIHEDEDRVVVLIDNNLHVEGIAYREATEDLPRY